jgi:two-component system response regulator
VKPPVILLVEDNDDDAELTARAFKDANISNPLERACDGVEALDFIFCKGVHASRDPAELPAVVLLDLKLPRLDGIDVLKAIRADEKTRLLPVVVLTSSMEEKDRLAAYDQCVNSYVRKPVDYQEFVASARHLGLYWMVLNVGPPRAS